MKDIRPVVTFDFDSTAQFLMEYMQPNKINFHHEGRPLLFRGESSESFSLIPSVLRENRQNEFYHLLLGAGTYVSRSLRNENNFISRASNEFTLMQFFYRTANKTGRPLPPIPYEWHERLVSNEIVFLNTLTKTWIPKEIEEIVALMQHYGLPTRMLDWSENVLIALYFAACGARERLRSQESSRNDHMVIWILRKPYECLGGYTTYEPFPIRFVTPPYANNPNLNAQKGVLTYCPLPLKHDQQDTTLPLDQIIEQYYQKPNTPLLYTVLTKIRIPITDCYRTMAILNNFGINDSMVFPEYTSITNQLRQNAKLVDEVMHRNGAPE